MWLAFGKEMKGPPIWARGQIVLPVCPKSYITAESIGFLEDFLVRRRLGARNFAELNARQVDAFLVLEDELAKEWRDGQHNARNAV